MKAYPFLISSPDGDVFRDNVLKISLRGVDGDLAIMAGHVPFITSVVPCAVEILLENEKSRNGHTDGGLLTVTKETVTLISGTFTWDEQEN